MKILMLSWEYPPKNIGGLSNHVYYLSKSLKNMGHEVHVITCEEGLTPIIEDDNGVIVHRVTPYKIDTEDFTKWVMQLNFAMVEEGVKIINKLGKFDIIHNHDWLSAYSAKALKWSYNIPMVATIHATEYGRNSGIRTEMQKYICSVESMLADEAWKVIGCSNYMRDEIINLFDTPLKNIRVISNGVDINKFNYNFDLLNFRRAYAKDDEKIVFFVGRLVFEKGVQLLVEAVPEIVKEHKNTKFIIAGKGPMAEELNNRVAQMGLSHKVSFVGYMEDETRDKLYKVADVAVVPSLYEPFGIVALEAMAAGCPVVVSHTGGLSEIIDHKYNGLTVIAGNSNSIKDNVLEILTKEEFAGVLKVNAYNTVKDKYTWERVAEATYKVYEEVKEEAKNTIWQTEKKKVTRRKKSTV